MTKAIFDKIEQHERLPSTSDSPSVVFVGANSKAELLYKNIPCEIAQKNYRYVLSPKEGSKQGDDFLSIFENSLRVQKILNESPASKIVFIIEAGCIFDARAKEFTEWLKLIDKSFDSKKILNSSCLVIESVSTDSDPISELQFLARESQERVSESGRQLLHEWLGHDKVKLIPNFTKKDLGEYNGEPFKEGLCTVLQKCAPLSYLNSIPFLPRDTIDTQREFYKEIDKEILGVLGEFISALEQNLKNYLHQSAMNDDLNLFRDKYHSVLAKLDIKEQIYESMINFCRSNFGNTDTLQKIADRIKLLQEKESTVVALMPGASDIYNADGHKLYFENIADSLKSKLKEVWERYLQEAETAERACREVYSLFESNEKCKLEIKKAGIDFYFQKPKPFAEERANNLIKPYQEFHSNFEALNNFCHSKNDLRQALIKSVEVYSKLTALHAAIHQSVVKSIEENQDVGFGFINSYMHHIAELYTALYAEHEDIIKALEKEHQGCISNRKLITTAVGGGVTTIGAAGLAAIAAETVGFSMIGIPMPLLTIAGTIGTVLGAGIIHKRKDIAENANLIKTTFEPLEKYYKQLPKDLREGWANINMSRTLSEYLKSKYIKEEAYLSDEYPEDLSRDQGVIGAPYNNLDSEHSHNSSNANIDGESESLLGGIREGEADFQIIAQ